MKNLVTAALALSLAAAGFAAGRLSAPETSQARAAPGMVFTQNAAPAQPQQQAPDDPRELIPLTPGPGQGPGQQPGQQPGQGQQPAECPVQIYQDGRLYTFPQPGGQQPGQQPGQGPGPGPGTGQPQELIPLNPGAPGGNPGGGTPSSPPPTTPPGTRS